ncbi:MAG: alcohol dehydrogenase [Proteobacteria bacterium]|nr:MAG: alcohol dehydrogenase [Pseudomonadota bacterium]
MNYRCMSLRQPGEPLRLEQRAVPRPGAGEVLLRVRACAVCRTDLHVVDGDLPPRRTPTVPGHEIVGEVVQAGADVAWPVGTRLGVPWLGYTCGACEYCRGGQENLCERAEFTGYDRDGGYAEYVVADARYCFELPDSLDDLHAAPLLCAGLIGYRSLKMAGDGRRLGIYGFGAAAHIIAQVAVRQGREVYAFTRPGDAAAQAFAASLGAHWTGGSDQAPPVALDAAILFAPVGALVPAALRAVRKGGIVVCGGIHMSDIPSFPYDLLWGERVVRSVANLTRQDAIEFLDLAPRIPVETHVEPFALEAANEALERLRSGALTGAAVLVPTAQAVAP